MLLASNAQLKQDPQNNQFPSVNSSASAVTSQEPESEDQIIQQILKLAFYNEDNDILQNDLIDLLKKVNLGAANSDGMNEEQLFTQKVFVAQGKMMQAKNNIGKVDKEKIKSFSMAMQIFSQSVKLIY